MKISAACLLLASGASAHPAGLECADDATTRLVVGKTIMGHPVAAAPAANPVAIAYDTYSQTLSVTAAAGVFFAVRASDGVSLYDLAAAGTGATVAMSTNCTSQAYLNSTALGSMPSTMTLSLSPRGPATITVGYGTGAAISIFSETLAVPVCQGTEYCCPDAKRCVTPTKTSCAGDAPTPSPCDAREVCCPLTKLCVLPGVPCTTSCGPAQYCCPWAKQCFTPISPGTLCASSADCGGGVCCGLTNECVTGSTPCVAP